MKRGILLAALMLLVPTMSQAKTLEELLVEKGVISKNEATAVEGGGNSKVYWNRGTRIEFPDSGFTTSIATQIQSRYEFTDADERATGQGNTSSFAVTRARLIIAGTALNREFSYKLQTDFTSAQNDTDNPASAGVRDAYIQWQPCDEGTGIRFGQFKTQISRQFNTDQATMQFADRSKASEYFTLGRQAGAMAFGSVNDGRYYGSVGIYNGQSTGEGINSPGNDTKHTGIASVRANPIGKMNVYEEGDIDQTDEAAVSLGAAYAYSDFNTSNGKTIENVDAHIISTDANFKYLGWSANAEFFYKSVRPDSAAKNDPLAFYVQGGYFVMPKKLELAGRYGLLDCDNGKGSDACANVDKINEVSATVNYYFWRHSLKAQFGYSHLNQQSSNSAFTDTDNNRWVFQVSSFF